MTDTDHSHRPFRLADLFLLTVGFAMGFALLAKYRAEAIEIGREHIPEMENPWLYRASPLELIATGLAFGVAASFPLVRGREAWTYPGSWKLRVEDAIGFTPLMTFAIFKSIELIAPYFEVPFVYLLIFLTAIAIQILSSAASVIIGCALAADRPHEGSWIKFLGLIASFANGAVLFRMINMA
ncbi:MAG: hypothetical protein SGJ19_25445, partial [Planctomycetia bacterium]|nr:hypothetical protein [Planctomycetia bacterium]